MTMQDGKNGFLAVISGLAAAVGGIDWATVVSMVVLPILFFAVGKFVDVRVQLYLEDRRQRRRDEDQN